MKYNNEYMLRTDTIRQFGEDVCEVATKCLSDRGYYGLLTTEDIYVKGNSMTESTINVAFAMNGEHITNVEYPIGNFDDLRELVAPVSNQVTANILELIKPKQAPPYKVWKVCRNGDLMCIDIGKLVSDLLYG